MCDVWDQITCGVGDAAEVLMSADAKLWQSVQDQWLSWQGTHDGPCRDGACDHAVAGTLTEMMAEIQECLGQSLRWELRIYPDGKAGLSGYRS